MGVYIEKNRIIVIKKFKIFESRLDIDPYNEEDWEDKGMEGKGFKLAIFDMYDTKSKNPEAKEINYGYKLAVPQIQKDLYIDFEVMKVTVYKVTRENWGGYPIDLLAWSYIVEHEQDMGYGHILPIGFEARGWDFEYVRVEDINNVDNYVDVMFGLNNKYRNKRCFVFDEDTPNDIVILYCEKLYEKIKEKYENSKLYKDVYMKTKIIKQD